jgi:F0F1-type ATP synthase assembly protein I
MSEISPQQAAQEKADQLIKEAPRRWAEATGIILICVGLFAFSGKYLDKVFGTYPWLFIIGIVVAFPISQYLIVYRLRKRFKLF